MSDLQELVSLHRQLDKLIENQDSNNPFLSDWNCQHPFYKDELNPSQPTTLDIQKYYYIRGDDALTQMISDFHSSRDNVHYRLNNILTGHGSTTMITTFFVWLRMQKIEYVYYIPPVYFTFHFFAKVYGIKLRPISHSHLFEHDAIINLPSVKSTLLICDPIWYAGSSINSSYMDEIRAWQDSTCSTVFVDGSFQYFNWDFRIENSSRLNKDLTLRLICPAKSLATHGFRYAYLILPEKLYDSFDFIADNLTGSSNLIDIEFAKNCMKVLNSRNSNSELINYTKNIFDSLKGNFIETEIIPNCGYFIFAKINGERLQGTAMDGIYFEQSKYKNYVRINLLSKSLQDAMRK